MCALAAAWFTSGHVTNPVMRCACACIQRGTYAHKFLI